MLSEVDCVLKDRTVRRPDVAVFLRERLEGIDPRRIPIPLPPDIAVEVISPSESASDVHRKTREYLAAGTQEVWEIDQENGQVFVHTRTGVRCLSAADTLETPVLPGWGRAWRNC